MHNTDTVWDEYLKTLSDQKKERLKKYYNYSEEFRRMIKAISAIADSTKSNKA